jgi:AraC-like DNA-binding protein
MPGALRTLDLNAAPGAWRLSSASPEPDLAGIVEEYWEVEGRIGAFRERVVPNGFVELMVNLGPVHHLLSDQGAGTWRDAWVSGLQDRSLYIESPDGTHLVSVRLHPLGARCVLGLPMSEVANSVVDLQTLIGAAAGRLRERLLAAATPEVRFAILERFVRRRLEAADTPHGIARWAAGRIEVAHGKLTVSSLCRDAGVSRKHLNALFGNAVGLSPKAYARVHRFAWVLGRIRDVVDVDWSHLAYRAGYADQAHLVRDFQRHAGTSPTAFVRARTPDGSALLVDAG